MNCLDVHVEFVDFVFFGGCLYQIPMLNLRKSIDGKAEELKVGMCQCAWQGQLLTSHQAHTETTLRSAFSSYFMFLISGSCFNP